MAKIEVILKAGEGITEEELEGATVTIFGDPLTHSTAGLYHRVTNRTAR